MQSVPSAGTRDRDVVVLGAGLAGLAACHDLVRAGARVTLIEAGSELGGLASSVRIEGHPVERFYHFICTPDHDLLQLIDELGLGSRLSWHPTHTSFYYHGHLYGFGSAFDLLRFTVVPWRQRLRFGMHILQSRKRATWKWLDQMPAKAWLVEAIGERAYDVIWDPLLRIKFGSSHERVSSAWVWHRIWRVAQSRRSPFQREMFGVLDDGSATLVDALADELRARPGFTLRTGTTVRQLRVSGGRITGVQLDGETLPCDTVLSTLALPVLDRLLPGASGEWFERARRIEYIGVICMLLVLRKPFGRSFWTNINDDRISFNGVIEQSLLNTRLRAAGLNLLYIPFYLPVGEPRWSFGDDELFEEYAAMLKLLNPAFGPDWVRERHVFREPYAQAVCTTNFAERVPGPRAPLRGLYVSDSTQFYPEDRSLSAAIQQGRKVANLILTDAI